MGFSSKAAELTKLLQNGGGLVEDATSALVLTLEQQSEYLSLLPEVCSDVAKRARVLFPLTARGRTSDGCGSYGRQFRDKMDRSTSREPEWYARLAEKFAMDLSSLLDDAPAAAAAELLLECAAAVRSANLSLMVERGEVEGDLDELGAVMRVCAPYATQPCVLSAMKQHARLLYTSLAALDKEIGVTSTKLYDAKLVLSAAARIAVEQRATDDADFAAFGLASDCLQIVDQELFYDLTMFLLTLHRSRRDRRAWRHSKSEGALHILSRTRLPPRTLILSDAGVDPNEDDIAAIMIWINLQLLSHGLVSL